MCACTRRDGTAVFIGTEVEGRSLGDEEANFALGGPEQRQFGEIGSTSKQVAQTDIWNPEKR